MEQTGKIFVKCWGARGVLFRSAFWGGVQSGTDRNVAFVKCWGARNVLFRSTFREWNKHHVYADAKADGDLWKSLPRAHRK